MFGDAAETELNRETMVLAELLQAITASPTDIALKERSELAVTESLKTIAVAPGDFEPETIKALLSCIPDEPQMDFGGYVETAVMQVLRARMTDMEPLLAVATNRTDLFASKAIELLARDGKATSRRPSFLLAGRWTGGLAQVGNKEAKLLLCSVKFFEEDGTELLSDWKALLKTVRSAPRFRKGKPVKADYSGWKYAVLCLLVAEADGGNTLTLKRQPVLKEAPYLGASWINETNLGAVIEEGIALRRFHKGETKRLPGGAPTKAEASKVDGTSVTLAASHSQVVVRNKGAHTIPRPVLAPDQGALAGWGDLTVFVEDEHLHELFSESPVQVEIRFGGEVEKRPFWEQVWSGDYGVLTKALMVSNPRTDGTSLAGVLPVPAEWQGRQVTATVIGNRRILPSNVVIVFNCEVLE